MGADRFAQLYVTSGLLDGAMQIRVMPVVPSDSATIRVIRAVYGWKHKLPASFSTCIRIFICKRIRKPCFTKAFLQIPLLIERVMQAMPLQQPEDLQSLMAIDAEARAQAEQSLRQLVS